MTRGENTCEISFNGDEIQKTIPNPELILQGQQSQLSTLYQNVSPWRQLQSNASSTMLVQDIAQEFVVESEDNKDDDRMQNTTENLYSRNGDEFCGLQDEI